MVASDVVMTNRHVAEVFCRMGRRRRWEFKPGVSSNIDYKEELSSPDQAPFALDSVIGVHEGYDLALFRVHPTSATPDSSLPAPLTISSQMPATIQDRLVYVCGYPAWDGRRNDPEPMIRIFTNIFNVKRLQPGKLRRFRDGDNVVTHDCSTLGGNSGSCVVDLETGHVVGLHFGGRYLEENTAVALWRLTSDPLLRRAKVNFA